MGYKQATTEMLEEARKSVEEVKQLMEKYPNHSDGAESPASRFSKICSPNLPQGTEGVHVPGMTRRM